LRKADLIDAVVAHTGLPKRDVGAVIEAAVETMAATLRRRETVQIVGFGAFEPRRRKPRLGRDPRTQDEIKVGVSWSLVFRPSKRLRASLNARRTPASGR